MRANPERTKEIRRRSQWKKWGLNIAEAERIYNSKSSCDICGIVVGGKNKQLDHDHETGKIRGVLCNNCNAMLGRAHENTEIFARAIDYMKDNS